MNPAAIIKNVLGALAVATLLIGSVYVQRWHHKAGQYDTAIAQRDMAEAALIGYHKDIQARDAASRSFHNELQQLQTSIDRRPVPVVRLCPVGPAAVVPATEGPAAGPGAAATAPAVVQPGAGPPGEAGPDIGPGLAALAARADALSAQLRAVQFYLQGAQ